MMDARAIERRVMNARLVSYAQQATELAVANAVLQAENDELRQQLSELRANSAPGLRLVKEKVG